MTLKFYLRNTLVEIEWQKSLELAMRGNQFA